MKIHYGIHRDLPREQYDQLDGINYSRLKYFEKSPLAYRHNCDHPAEQTDAMRLGLAAHLAILEPGLDKFAIWTGGRRFGKEWNWFKEQHGHLTILNETELDHVSEMKAAVQSHPPAYRYLRHATTEVTLFWREPALKRDCKARLDAWVEIGEDTFLVSLKTTSDVSEKWFARQYADMCYHAQDAFYQGGFWRLNNELPKMVTIAVEPKPPYEVAVYTIGTDILRLGQQKIAEWMQKLEQCEKSGKWPGAVESEQELTLPSWAYPQGDFEFDDLAVEG